MISFLFILFSQASFAETKMMVPTSFQRIPVEANPLSLSSNSQYRVLMKKFEAGHTLELARLKGWYTGRCFFADSPSHAVATLLAADRERHLKTNGPAFASDDFRHVTPLIDTQSGADKFDVIDQTEFVEAKKVLNGSRELNAFPVHTGDEIVVAGYRTTDLESRAYRFRKSGRYLIMKLECGESDYCSNF